jgi:hypothetical protein
MHLQESEGLVPVPVFSQHCSKTVAEIFKDGDLLEGFGKVFDEKRKTYNQRLGIERVKEGPLLTAVLSLSGAVFPLPPRLVYQVLQGLQLLQHIKKGSRVKRAPQVPAYNEARDAANLRNLSLEHQMDY